jgi:hypothetical protein
MYKVPANTKAKKQRVLDPAFDHQERDQNADRHGQEHDRSRGAPAVLRCLRDRIHQQHESAGSHDRAERVEPPTRRDEPTVGNDPRGERECHNPDRHVHIEDGLPAGVLGENPTGDQSGRAGRGA